MRTSFSQVAKVSRWIGVSNVVGGASEVRVEATQQVEDELRVEDSVSNITNCIGGSLHLFAVLINGEVALSHVVKLVTKEDGVGGLARL